MKAKQRQNVLNPFKTKTKRQFVFSGLFLLFLKMQNEALNFNVYNIIILCASIQGILFGLAVLLSKKYKSTSNFYLAQVILFLSLNNLFYWFADSRLGFRFQYFYNLYIPWILLVLPYYYLFVASYLGKELSFKMKNILKLPFYISLAIHLILFTNKVILSDALNISTSFISTFYIGEEYVAAIFTFVVIYKAFMLLKEHKIANNSFSIQEIETKTRWLIKILYSGILICSIWLVLVVYNDVNSQDFFSNNGKYFLWGTSSILIYWMGYLGVYHNGVFRQREIIRNNLIASIPEPKGVQKNKLNISKFEEIDTYIRKEKLFLNPNLSLSTLVTQFDLSEGYISQLVNNFSDSNFSTYINKLRIEQSQFFLQNKEYKNYTIISIALESGFNSKSAFYNAFKKETGVSPTEYKEKNLS